MPETVYRIAQWEEIFENNRTRGLKNLQWVPFPNKHDGDGFTELMEHENGIAHYGAWCLMVQVASKCHPRGTLLRDGGRPHKATSLARVTRSNRAIFDEAIPRLLEIRWLEEVSLDSVDLTEIQQESAEIPHDDAPSRARAQGMEWNGMEGKGMEGKGRGNQKERAPAQPLSCPPLSEPVAPASSTRPSGEFPPLEEIQAVLAPEEIAPDFIAMVWNAWTGRSGKDASNVPVEITRYVRSRWNAEKEDWKAGRHSTQTKKGHHAADRRPGPHRHNRNTGTANEGRGAEYNAASRGQAPG